MKRFVIRDLSLKGASYHPLAASRALVLEANQDLRALQPSLPHLSVCIMLKKDRRASLRRPRCKAAQSAEASGAVATANGALRIRKYVSRAGGVDEGDGTALGTCGDCPEACHLPAGAPPSESPFAERANPCGQRAAPGCLSHCARSARRAGCRRAHGALGRTCKPRPGRRDVGAASRAAPRTRPWRQPPPPARQIG